jgi:hypothetical protein
VKPPTLLGVKVHALVVGSCTHAKQCRKYA